jgi:hypothetical protein
MSSMTGSGWSPSRITGRKKPTRSTRRDASSISPSAASVFPLRASIDMT